MDETEDLRRKRLLYQASRRGFKEADIVIGGFAARDVPAMSRAELDQFESLLAHPDHDLYAWARGECDPEPALVSPVLERLRAFVKP